ncbi:MAG TPA: ADP-ribose pyrophosphatase, partial [Alistipes obesi]|nr:ADP-ribose pyrophosphatase [Alistipes communis]
MCRTIYFADKILLFSSRPVGEPYHEIPLEAGTTLPQAKILNFLETFNFVAVVT